MLCVMVALAVVVVMSPSSSNAGTNDGESGNSIEGDGIAGDAFSGDGIAGDVSGVEEAGDALVA